MLEVEIVGCGGFKSRGFYSMLCWFGDGGDGEGKKKGKMYPSSSSMRNSVLHSRHEQQETATAKCIDFIEWKRISSQDKKY